MALTGEETSYYFETTSGVKQGFSLSTLPFALNINDLLAYADDILTGDIQMLQTIIKNLKSTVQNGI